MVVIWQSSDIFMTMIVRGALMLEMLPSDGDTLKSLNILMTMGVPKNIRYAEKIEGE